ncbi:hypothetical protein K1F50_19910 [Muricauda oceani]|uniref:Uncharacterized protein n=1 Tax=Flagellimonas oceani TaxID=2698672 RepID=A0A6G7J300_9FLAO|nr:hypothetical protein [Allomuricauda oceani]MBW8245081.1 hypothetical protein [Allomuricauda oceani]QII44847.1 hypothetical protein GVT53_09180 [Allomuricauda oceani]
MRKIINTFYFILSVTASVQGMDNLKKVQPSDDMYLISDGQAGIFKIGESIPFAKSKDLLFKVRKEIQTKYTDEGSEDIPVYIFSIDDKDQVRITPEFDYSSYTYNTNIGVIDVLSEEFQTQENIGLGTTIEKFVMAHPDYQLWYSYINDNYFIETNDKIQFFLNKNAYIGGEISFESDLTALNISDFNTKSTIESIQIRTVWYKKALNDFLPLDQLKNENLISSYEKFDFSEIWTQTPSNGIFGIIGENYQRIKIKLLSIEKDSENSRVYKVKGKSNVKGNICEFQGTITLTRIFGLKEVHPKYLEYEGIDLNHIKDRGVLTANYKFHENKSQKYSGAFKGSLYSKWYLNIKNEIKYDDFEVRPENNAFIGKWTDYKTKKAKICYWADYYVPNVGPDFDTGAGEFYPNGKYDDKGWRNFKKAWFDNDEKAKEIELAEWWKD